MANGVRAGGSQSCGPLRDHAEQFAKRKREELFAGKLGVRYERTGAGWKEFAEAYLDHCRKHKAPRTVRNFDGRAMELAGERFGGRSPAGIGPADVGEWETTLLERFNPATVHMWLRCLRTALRWGKANGFVKEVPTFHFPRVDKVGRVLTDSEVSALLDAISPRARGPVIFALHTGVRRGELLSLGWERVRQSPEGHMEAEIGGVGGPETKTGASRVIPLHPRAVEAMGATKRAGRCFPKVSEHISHDLLFAARKAKLGRVRVHDLRHTWATRYMQATGDLFGLMQLGGWANLGSVKVYQHLTKTRAASALSVTYEHITHKK